MFSGQDLQYEEEVARNPYHLKAWTSYLQYKKGAAPVSRYFIFERALKFLPRSYKLWFSYLTERRKHLLKKSITHPGYVILVDAFERSLIHMNKMPRIWREYLEVLSLMKKGTSCRHAFDRALQSLPITQHKEIWNLFIPWAKDLGVKETVVRVFRRYLMFDPNRREEFVEYLEEIGHFEEAAKQLVAIINDEHFVSPQGFTKHQMWMRLCDICATHPEEVQKHLKIDSIIRSGIARFSDEVGRLWVRLADVYTRQGLFEKARDVYEEALNSVSTVKDFTIVFDSYVKVEENILIAKMRMAENPESSDEEGEEEKDDGAAPVEAALADDVNLRLARIDYLLDKRPILLSSVVLRQNPHNVFEWHKRVKQFKSDFKGQLITYMEAIKTIDPKLANGKLSGIWIAFAKFYEKNGDVDSARLVFEKATKVNFKTVDELATVWCAWGEFELRNECYDRAMAVMQQAISEPPASVRRRKAKAAAQGKAGDDEAGDTLHFEGSVAADRVYKNVRVWSLYLDLEESLGTLESCKAAYDRVIEIKVVTPQMALNYASYLEERDCFEDSFRVYEQAVALFTFPQLKIIWNTYLDKFMARYAGSKIERLRDLFEQVLEIVPPEDSTEFFLKYFKAEEAYGMARHALSVLDRATRAVPEATRLDMYRLYVKKVGQHFGVTKVRPVYERAIAELSDDQSRQLCLEFAEMERKLGEIDRARAILQHGSQFSDPRREAGFWQTWREFEEAHGNEDTYKDMLRVQRSIETAYSQANYLAAEMVAGEALANAPVGDMEMLAKSAEKEALARSRGEGGGGGVEDGLKRKFQPSTKVVLAAIENQTKRIKTAGLGSNPDEIDIDAVGGEGEGEGGEEEDSTAALPVVQKPVPLAVFGKTAVETGVIPV